MKRYHPSDDIRGINGKVRRGGMGEKRRALRLRWVRGVRQEGDARYASSVSPEGLSVARRRTGRSQR